MYGIATAQAIPDSTRICLGSVELSALEWPAACGRLRGGSAEQCGRVVCALCAAATHSVVVLGFSTYVFLRSDHGEESEAIPGLCLAAHHLLGHFVVESPEQFMAASGASGDAGDAVVAQCLRDTRGGARVAMEAAPHKPIRKTWRASSCFARPIVRVWRSSDVLLRAWLL